MPHLFPHRPRHYLTAPAAALTMLAVLAGCTSTTAATQAASGAAATTIRITGAGSTFDAPFFDVAFPRYQ